MVCYFEIKRKLKMNIQQKLSWLLQMGVTHFCAESIKTQHMTSASPSADIPATEQASAQAVNASDLPALNALKENFDLSSLKKTASHTILGQGPSKPKLMCVLETPSADSDRSGLTLSGPQGDLLTKMMKAIHLDIEKEVYIAYLCPWRTPGNRALTESEQALFLPFLAREIELVHPQKLLLFGAPVANALLKTGSLAKARGVWHKFQNIPVRVTLSLAALKTDSLKRQAWQDLQEVEKELTK